jgi:hypothetical protein
VVGHAVGHSVVTGFHPVTGQRQVLPGRIVDVVKVVLYICSVIESGSFFFEGSPKKLVRGQSEFSHEHRLGG